MYPFAVSRTAAEAFTAQSVYNKNSISAFSAFNALRSAFKACEKWQESATWRNEEKIETKHAKLLHRFHRTKSFIVPFIVCRLETFMGFKAASFTDTVALTYSFFDRVGLGLMEASKLLDLLFAKCEHVRGPTADREFTIVDWPSAIHCGPYCYFWMLFGKHGEQ